MQRTLECDVCMHVYDMRTRQPKSLLCGHGFCLMCVTDMMREKRIVCPRCRATCDIPSGQVSKLPTNYTILELLDTVCKECKDRPYTKRCHHCDQNLCDMCQTRHVPGTNSQFDYSSSLEDMIMQLTRLKSVSQEMEGKIRRQGEEVVLDLSRVHEEKLKRLEEIYERQLAEVNLRVRDDLEVQTKWAEVVNKALNEAKVFKDKCQSNSVDNKIKDQYYIQTKSALDRVHQSQPIPTKIWIDDMLEEFQLFVTKSAKVSITSGGNQSRVKKQQSCPVARSAPVGDYTTTMFKAMVGERGCDKGDFKNPRGATIGHMGEIFIADWLNDRLKVLDTNLNVVRMIPIDGAFDLCKLDGYIFVTQSSKRQIYVLSDHGDPLNVIGADQVKLEDPRGIAADRDGLLYVCDSGDRCIKIVKPSGEYVSEFGYDVFEDVGPRYIAISTDKIYVSDNNYNLHTFSRNKRQLLNTLKGGLPPSNLRATGIAIDAEDNLILSDSCGRLVVMKDLGRVVSVIGSKGRAPGQLRGPEGVVITGQGEIVVCDGGNDRVVMYTVASL